jgi:hypothetical protein
MTVNAWLEAAMLDAERRGLPALKPLLEALAKSTSALRAADWNADGSGGSEPPGNPSPESRIPNPGNVR